MPQIIDSCFFDDYLDEARAIRKAYGADGRKIFGYLVSFNSGSLMDFDRVVDLYLAARDSCPDLFFLVIGGGKLEGDIKGMLKKRGIISGFAITGYREHNKIPAYLQACDALLVYMKDGNMGNAARVSLKVIEYLASKKPVFGRVVGETRRLMGAYVFDEGSMRYFAAGEIKARDLSGLLVTAYERRGKSCAGCCIWCFRQYRYVENKKDGFVNSHRVQGVSVVIPFFNASDTIVGSVGAVLKSDYIGPLEVLCVDDGSTDGGGDILAEYFKSDHRVKVLRQSNLGLLPHVIVGLLLPFTIGLCLMPIFILLKMYIFAHGMDGPRRYDRFVGGWWCVPLTNRYEMFDVN